MSDLERPATSVDHAARAGLLMSIRPQYVDLILSGRKTVELRRKAPKSCPAVVVMYASGNSRQIEGSATLASVQTSTPDDIWARFGGVSGLSRDAFDAYFDGAHEATALLLAQPARARRPLPLSDLRLLGLEPPQSWRYIDGDRLRTLERSMFRGTDATDDQPGHSFSPLAALWSRLHSQSARVAGRRHW